jgi:hypothetical protein
MPGQDNSGIHVGNITGTGIAVGHGASARVSSGSDANTLALIDELISRLLATIGELPPEQAATVAGEAVTIKQEVHSERPDRGRIGNALQALGSVAATAAPVIEIARQLADLVTQLLH